MESKGVFFFVLTVAQMLIKLHSGKLTGENEPFEDVSPGYSIAMLFLNGIRNGSHQQVPKTLGFLGILGP